MKKRITILLLVFSLGFSLPFYSSHGAGAIAYITKEFSLDTLARLIARRALSTLGNSVVNTINNIGVEDGQKAPSFVQNWKKFLADSQRIGENQFRAQLNYAITTGILCDDLKGPLSLAFQASNVPFVDVGDPDKNAELKQNTLTPFQTKMRCTIPDKTREEFKKDFEKGGGWDTWSRMLEPQNNLAGTTLLSVEELQRQRSSQEQSQTNEAVAGQGFQGAKGACRQATSVQDTVCYKNCQNEQETKGTYSNDPRPLEVICTEKCQGQTAVGANAQCSFMGKTVTPAKVLGEGAANFLDSNANFLVTSDELSEVVISIVSALQNKIVDFAGKAANGLLPGSGDFVEQQAPNFLEDALKDRKNLKNASKLPSGSSCGEDSECQSNFCAETICE